MKVQDLAIIFIIIILPISLVISTYTQYQIQTINTQTLYDNKLTTATYDAIRAFQINTTSSTTSDLTNSKSRDLEASISTFRNSIKSTFSLAGYSEDTLDRYIPALVYTLYDGFYIYSPYKNIANEDGTVKNNTNDASTQYGVKPYISYSCRYKKGDIDVVITYSLDNHIAVKGMVGNEYVNKDGYLIDGITCDESKTYEEASITYNGIKIETEQLKEYLPNGTNTLYPYAKVNGTKYYEIGSGSNAKIVYIRNGNIVEQCKSGDEEFDAYDKIINNNYLAKEYYYKAYVFTKWFKSTGLKELIYSDAYDEDLVNNNSGTSDTKYQQIWADNSNKIFQFADTAGMNIENESSTFNQHRMQVIRHKIETNMAIAISNYNAYSNVKNVFQMPELKETEWDQIIHNISLISFLQGLPIGGKIYNGHTVVTNSESEEVVLEKNIYLLGSDKYYHRIGDKKLESGGDVQLDCGIYGRDSSSAGRLNLNFSRRNVMAKDSIYYYYPLRDYNASYNSVIMQDNLTTYDDIYKYVSTQSDVYKKAFYTALGREREGQYKSTNEQLINYKNILVVGYSAVEFSRESNIQNICNQLNQEKDIQASYVFNTDSKYLENYIRNNMEKYDLVIIDSAVWVGPISQDLINKMLKKTNVFTISNDAGSLDIFRSDKDVTGLQGQMSITTMGTEKLGGNYTTSLTFSDSYQRAVDFNDDVQVLYETLYNTGERHDAVGLRNTGGYNWMHSQVGNLDTDMTVLKKLAEYTIENKAKTTLTGNGEYGKIGKPRNNSVGTIGVNPDGNTAQFGFANIDMYSLKISNQTGTIVEYDGNNNTGNGHNSTTTTWKNLVKNSNNGTIIGGTWGSNYLRLNGTNNWVNIGQINFTTQAEFDATIVVNSIKDGEADIAGNFNLGGAGIWLSDGYPAFDIYSEKQDKYISIKSEKRVTVGQKTRIVGRYDGRNLYLYVDGRLVAQTNK